MNVPGVNLEWQLMVTPPESVRPTREPTEYHCNNHIPGVITMGLPCWSTKPCGSPPRPLSGSAVVTVLSH